MKYCSDSKTLILVAIGAVLGYGMFGPAGLIVAAGLFLIMSGSK